MTQKIEEDCFICEWSIINRELEITGCVKPEDEMCPTDADDEIFFSGEDDNVQERFEHNPYGGI